MTYTQIALCAAVIAIVLDRYFFQTNLIRKKAFWASYAIIVPFQLLTNWWLTSRNIVMYHDDAILGYRIASAPVEDLFFGFALILGVLASWIHAGRPRKN